MYSATFHINMDQFRKKWNVYQNNVLLFEGIHKCKGSFFTLDSRHIEYWLNEFNIFYTKRV